MWWLICDDPTMTNVPSAQYANHAAVLRGADGEVVLAFSFVSSSSHDSTETDAPRIILSERAAAELIHSLTKAGIREATESGSSEGD